MLRRNNVELLILSVTYLKKLSIYKENKEEMIESGIVERLSKLVTAKNDALVMQTLRLLHNLSFDERLRGEMARNSLIPQLVGHMKNPKYETQVLGLLYHMSIEDTNKSMFSYTDALDIVYERLLKVEDARSRPELIALAVNLSQNHRNAEVMAQGGRLERLVRHTLQTEDELLMKIVRNISQHEDLELKGLFKPFVAEFAAAVQEPHLTADFALELLGTLGNIALPEFDYEALIQEHGLIAFLGEHLVPVETEDDMLLEAVIFLGTIFTATTAATLLEGNIGGKLLTLLEEKKEDHEIVLQTAFTLHKLLLFPETRGELLDRTQVLAHLVDLLNVQNSEVKQTADKALDYVMDVSEEHAPRIRAMKFETFNQEWIQVVAGGSGGAGAREEGRLGHAAGQAGDLMGSSYDFGDSAELDLSDQLDLPYGDDAAQQLEEYDHEDQYVYSNDAYGAVGGLDYDARELSAYTSWQ